LAQIAVTDIAGLVKGASNGEGLGNAFLSHISAVDGLYHVVRAFPDEDVTHNDGEVDPIRDIETINAELRAKDLQFLAKAFEDVAAQLKRAKEKKRLEEKHACLMRVKETLEKGEHVKDQEWGAKEIDTLNEFLFLTSKPVVYLVNIGMTQYIKK